MKSIKEISLLNTETSATTIGVNIFPPIIKGFSTLGYPIYSGGLDPVVFYLQIDKFPSTIASKYRGVIVEGYVRPVNQETGINSNRIGLPFTHYAMLIPSTIQGQEELIYDSIGEEHTLNSNLPPSSFPSLGVETCWYSDPFNPNDNPVFYNSSTSTLSFGIKLKLGDNINNGQYLVNGIYYLI